MHTHESIIPSALEKESKRCTHWTYIFQIHLLMYTFINTVQTKSGAKHSPISYANRSCLVAHQPSLGCLNSVMLCCLYRVFSASVMLHSVSVMVHSLSEATWPAQAPLDRELFITGLYTLLLLYYRYIAIICALPDLWHMTMI